MFIEKKECRLVDAPIIHISKTQKQRMAVNHYIKTNISPSILKNEVIWLLREWNLEEQFNFTEVILIN